MNKHLIHFIAAFVWFALAIGLYVDARPLLSVIFANLGVCVVYLIDTAINLLRIRSR